MIGVGLASGRVALAASAAAAAELAGVGLMATAAWLLLRAAEHPPLGALAIAIVVVRTLAIGRGGLRYAERLVGHTVVLEHVTELRGRLYDAVARRPSATAAGRPDDTAAGRPDDTAAGRPNDTAAGCPDDTAAGRQGDTAAGRLESAGAGRRDELSDGDALSRLVSDVDAVQDALLRCLVPWSTAGVVAAAVAVAAFAVDSRAGALVAGGALVLVALAVGVARSRDADGPVLRARLAVEVTDLLRGSADLAAFGAAGRFRAAAVATSARIAEADRRRSDGAASAVVAVVGAAVALGGGLLCAHRGLPVAAAVALGLLAAFDVALPAVTAARGWPEHRAALDRLRELLTAPPPDPPPTEPLPTARVVALVGPSGSGKTTMLRRIAAGLDPARVRGVFADDHVFTATLRDNVFLGAPPPDPTQLDPTPPDTTTDPPDTSPPHTHPPDTNPPGTQLAGTEPPETNPPHTHPPGTRSPGIGSPGTGAVPHESVLATWLADLPDGWDTELSSGALSGGQRARLLLARALAAAPEVLLLDEPVEGLDPATADALMTDLLAYPGRVVVATHRLASLPGAEEILVLHDGRIVQRGPHAALLAQPGYYRDRWLTERALDELARPASAGGRTRGR